MQPVPRRSAHRKVISARVRRNRVFATVALGVLLVAGIAGVALAGSSKHSPSPTTPTVASDRCPLTDLPAPGGKVPDRPALAVKVGNEPEGARPQSGLNEADVVYDTPAEGFIMRYIAVYQCSDASSIGPTRSERWVDPRILQVFPEVILAFAGGINPDVDYLSTLPWLHEADLLAGAQSAGVRITSRVPPDNLYTSTSALYGLFPHLTTAPPPIFSYSSGLPGSAVATASLAINFSYETDVVWKWDAAADAWEHTYSGTPDVDAATNEPVTASNVVVQIVHYTLGPYPECTGCTGDVESQTVGSGPGYVLRGGKSIRVTWHRAALDDPTTFTDAAGQAVGLTPGRTWVELVPNTVADVAGNLTLTP